MDYQTLLVEATALKEAQEDLRSATYTVLSYNDNERMFYFIASYSIDDLTYEYTVADENFIALRALSQLTNNAIVAYGDFIRNMELFVSGAINHPYADSICDGEQPLVMPNEVTGYETANSVDDSDFNLG